MADVFISYSHASEELVQKIANALKTVNLSCWYMSQDSYSGSYQIAIPKAINECFVFLLILDKNSNLSEEVLEEANLAKRRWRNDEPIELMIFHADDCDFYAGIFATALNTVVRIPANPPTDEDIRELAEKVANTVRRVKLRARNPSQRMSAETQQLSERLQELKNQKERTEVYQEFFLKKAEALAERIAELDVEIEATEQALKWSRQEMRSQLSAVLDEFLASQLDGFAMGKPISKNFDMQLWNLQRKPES